MEKAFKALGSEPRRRVLNLLLEGPMTVGEVGNHFDMALPSISKHLAILKEAGFVSERKRGQYVLYSLEAERMADAVLGFLAPFCDDVRAIVENKGKRNRS